MDYQEIIAKLEENKRNLLERLEDKNLSGEELEAIHNSIENYNYIIELTEMNHFQRGAV